VSGFPDPLCLAITVVDHKDAVGHCVSVGDMECVFERVVIVVVQSKLRCDTKYGDSRQKSCPGINFMPELMPYQRPLKIGGWSH